MEKILTRATIDQLEESTRTIKGCAIVFNRWSNDLGGFIERILPESITQELIDNSDVIANCEHNSEDYMLARCRKGEGTLKLELREDGVYFEFEAPETEKGNDILYHVRNGNIFECSFAFTLPEGRSGEKWYKEDGQLKRDITKIAGLYDISLVGRAAYSDTFCYNRSIPQDVIDEFAEQEEIIKEEVRELPEQETITNNKTIKKIMEKRFSLVNAINNIANNKTLDEVAQAVGADGKEEMRKSGMSFGGQIQLPVNELRSAISVTAEGEDVVATELYDIMAPLRAKNVLVGAGAKFLTGLVGDVQIPVMTAGNVGWAGELAEASEKGDSFSHITLSPKRLTAYVDISKQLLNQDSVGVENMIRQDIVNAINSKLEATVLGNAAGSTTQPAGLFYKNASDDTKSTIKANHSVAAATTMAKIAEVESIVEAANVLGDCKYIVSPSYKATLRDKAKGANVSESLFVNGEIDGTKAFSTGHVGANAGIYGDFSNLAIGQWGAIDLTVDNYTQATKGCVRLVINAYFDAAVLRPEAFVKITSGTDKI